MSNPFTIRIFVPEGDPEGIRIIDRLSSTGIFYAFPRNKWQELKKRPELDGAGIYILSGYANPEDDLPTIYVGQADTVRSRIEQHLRNKDFWDKAVVFVSADKLNATHARWLEYALLKQANSAGQSILENGNSPQEPKISEAEKAEMQVFLNEIIQTLPLVGVRAFETPRSIAQPEVMADDATDRNTVIVPAQKDGFEEVFLGKQMWYAIRIWGGMLEKIKYIAAYQTAPVSAITHIASVSKIEPYGEEGKYRLLFNGAPEELQNPIVSDLSRGSMQGPRYTHIDKIRKATKMSELFD